MAFTLKDRRVSRFRTQIDPMIGVTPKNAFDMNALPTWHMELTPIGVYVKARFQKPGSTQMTEEEHIIPYANIQSIKLYAEDKPEQKPDPKTA